MCRGGGDGVWVGSFYIILCYFILFVNTLPQTLFKLNVNVNYTLL